MKNQDVLFDQNTPPVLLSDINFSVRTTNIFKTYNINSINQFLTLQESDLKSFENLGNNSINEIKSIQRSIALSFDIDNLYNVSKEEVLMKTDSFFEDNGLSRRAINILNDNGIYMAEQLSLSDEDIFFNISGCGKSTLEEILLFRKSLINNNSNLKLMVLKKYLSNINDANLSLLVIDVFNHEIGSLMNSLGVFNFYNLKNSDDDVLNQLLSYFNEIYNDIMIYKTDIQTILYDLLWESIRRPKANGEWSKDRERDVYVLHKRAAGATLEEVGKELHITREGVRQLEKRILEYFSEKASKYVYIYIKKLFGTKIYKYINELEDCLLELSDIFVYFLTDNDSSYCLFNKTFNILMLNNNWIKIVEDWFNEKPIYIEKSSIDEMINDCHYYLNLLQLSIDIDDIYKVFNYCYKHDYKVFIARKKLIIYDVLIFILKNHFATGIDIYNNKSLTDVRKYAGEIFGIELSEDDRTIGNAISRKGILIDRGVWTVWNGEILPNSIIIKIYEYVEKYVIDTVPISAIFNALKEDLVCNKISNRFHLQGILSRDESFKYKINRDYVLKSSTFSVYESIEKYILNETNMVSFEMIQEQFPGISGSIMQSVINNTSIINMNGYYTSLQKLNITTNDIALLKEFLDSYIIDSKPYYSGELFKLAKQHMNDFFAKNGFVDYQQFYYLISKLFKNDYSFSRPYVSVKGSSIISSEEQLIEFIEDNLVVEISVLRDYAKKIGTYIDSVIGFVNRNGNRIAFKNSNSIIAHGLITVDDNIISEIDKIFDDFLFADFYRPLVELDDNIIFPECGIEINEWSLFSILNQHSKKYKVVTSSNKKAQAIPIVCKKNFDEKNIKMSLINNKKIDNYLDMLLLEEL